MAVRMKKFSENTSTITEVMDFSKFSQFFFGGGGPVPLRVCASKPWLISSVCKNSRAQHRLRAEIQFPEKIPLGCTFIRVNNFLFVDQSTPIFFA